jgi:ParB family transcriptional regulator, chromosome partitioning protein
MASTSPSVDATVSRVDPKLIAPNPLNPRRFFNQAALDILQTSIHEVGILVPLIVYPDPERSGEFVLLDGERRWTCALRLGLDVVPVNVIPPPTSLENVLRMFNIHAVREEWPLISIALSLQQVISDSGEDREARLAELTGLTRGTVRRAKKLLNLPLEELALIQSEAELDREQQVHREDLYLEVSDADAAIRRHLPSLAERYPREDVIRQLVRKREESEGQGYKAVTDYRSIPQLLRGIDKGLITRNRAEATIERLITEVDLNPKSTVDRLIASRLRRADVRRRADALTAELASLKTLGDDDELASALRRLMTELRRLLR